MKAGDDFIVTATTRDGSVFELRASVRAVVPREDEPDLVVLGPMFLGARPPSFPVIRDDVEYEVIPT